MEESLASPSPSPSASSPLLPDSFSSSSTFPSDSGHAFSSPQQIEANGMEKQMNVVAPAASSTRPMGVKFPRDHEVVPMPRSLQYLSSSRALTIFLLTLLTFAGISVISMLLLAAFDSSTSVTTVKPQTQATIGTNENITDRNNHHLNNHLNDNDNESSSDPLTNPAPPDDIVPPATMIKDQPVPSDSSLLPLVVTRNPEQTDTKVTALQFLWILSPTVATILLWTCMNQLQQKVNKTGSTTEHLSQPRHSNNQESVGSTTAAKDNSTATTLQLPEIPRTGTTRPIVNPLAPFPTGEAQPSPAGSPVTAATPTLGLNGLNHFQPLLQSLLSVPQVTHTPGSSVAMTQTTASFPLEAAIVDNTSAHFSVPPPSDTPTPLPLDEDLEFREMSRDLLLRMPYIPFLGLPLPSLLIETRSKTKHAMIAALERQPRLERLGLRLLFATSLPKPTILLRRWIFRTHYTRLQRWPALIAFIAAGVALPTILAALFAITQYLIASISGAQGWYDDSALAHLQSSLRLSSSSSPGLAISLGFLYELLVGVWWDIIPITSADWGNGIGFSGASWIILAFMEEFGWMGGLFPCLYYNTRIRTWSSALTRKYYKSAASSRPNMTIIVPTVDRNSVLERPNTDSEDSKQLDIVPTPPESSSGSSSNEVTTNEKVVPPSFMNDAKVGSEWIHLTLVCFILGTIWSAWHWPFILLKQWMPAGVGYVPGTKDTPLAFGFFMWVPRIIATRFVLMYLTLSAGSYWAGVVFHAAHNVMVYSYWAVLPDTDAVRFPFARYMHAESGITVVVGYLLTAIAVVMIWKKGEEEQRSAQLKQQILTSDSRSAPTTSG